MGLLRERQTTIRPRELISNVTNVVVVYSSTFFLQGGMWGKSVPSLQRVGSGEVAKNFGI